MTQMSSARYSVLVQEQAIRYRNVANQFQIAQLQKLKEHKDTIKPPQDYKTETVVDYIASAMNMEEVKEAKIYMTTNRAIHSLHKFVEEEIEKEVKQSNGNIDRTKIIALAQQNGSFKSAYGFFSIPSKEIYIVRDIHLYAQQYGKDKKKKKNTKGDTWKADYGYKPARFSHAEWLKIRFRSVLAHELVHFYVDKRSKSHNAIMQEEFAYKHMIGWCRKEGLRDSEILKAFLLGYGKLLALQEDPTLELKIRKKDFQKKAIEHAQGFITRFNNIIAPPDEIEELPPGTLEEAIKGSSFLRKKRRFL